MSAIIPISDIERMGSAIAKSGLFGMKTPEQAVALMLIAQAEGLHPAIAARDYHVIQGRPSLKADAMLARFQAAGGKVVWQSYTDTRVAAEFSHPQGGALSVEWTMDRARAAGLTGKDNWKNYPRQMLRARVISEGIRTIYPGVCVGIYTTEETQDFEPRHAREAEAVITDPPSAPAPVERQPGEDPAEPAPASDPLPWDANGADPLPSAPPPPPTKPMISEAQRKRLYAISKASARSDEWMRDLISRHGFASSTEITRDKYEAIVSETQGVKP